MGSRGWFKNIISKRKVNGGRSQKLKGHSAQGNEITVDLLEEKDHALLYSGSSAYRHGGDISNAEDAAATRIQAACRAYLARKKLHHMRGMARLHNLVQRTSVKKQSAATLTHLHSWSKIQAEIRARRTHMVTEGRLRQKKAENQLKLEAKLHDLEVEWSSGSETIDAALARIHQREEAALRRERAMAYAFSHQWRANCSPNFGSGNQDLSNANWGWSWIDNWIAARPWEGRFAAQGTPKKTSIRQPNKNTKKANSPMSNAPDKAKVNSSLPKRSTIAKASKQGEKKGDSKLASKAGDIKTNGEKD